MADNDQEKTEQPTSRRREQARDEGNVAVSKEVSSFFVLAGALIVLYFTSSWMLGGVAEFMKDSFSTVTNEMTVADVIKLSKSVVGKFLIIIIPLFFIPLFGAVSYIMQNGFSLSTKSLEPNFSKIDPLAGTKRIFSLNSVSELVKSVLKVSVITYVVYGAVENEWQKMPFLMDLDTASLMIYVGKVSFSIMLRTVWVVAAIAALDYIFQKYNFEKGLKMTKEEIKEEMKEMEGDPMVKARIRSIQRDMARKRMMQDVPTADFVVTNPTHLAVALKYDREKGGAPLVVAKGAGHVAARIRELAKEHNVPVIENKPLARTLFKLVEVGSEIPGSMYKAVAEMLAYVYKLKSRSRN